MADLLVIVPTRGRADNAARVLAAWDATSAWDCADLALAVDRDDPAIDDYRRLAAGPAGRGFWVLAEQPGWQPMVAKLNATAAVHCAGGYWALGFAGDDHLPRTPGWAGRYLAALRELGTGIVYGDDGLQGRRLPTQWAMTADIVRALGRMVPAPVEHLYCDNAIKDLGQATGCLRYLPDVLIEHMHPLAGKAPSDAGYRRVNSGGQYARDAAAYREWRDGRLADDARAVRALLPGAS